MSEMKDKISIMKNPLEELNTAKEKIRELKVIAIALSEIKHTKDKKLKRKRTDY